jgi:hypothetical protein
VRKKKLAIGHSLGTDALGHETSNQLAVSSPVTNLKGLVSTGSSGSDSGIAPILANKVVKMQLNRNREAVDGGVGWQGRRERRAEERTMDVGGLGGMTRRSCKTRERPSEKQQYPPATRGAGIPFPTSERSNLGTLRHSDTPTLLPPRKLHVTTLDLLPTTRVLQQLTMYPTRVLGMQASRPLLRPTPVSRPAEFRSACSFSLMRFYRKSPRAV